MNLNRKRHKTLKLLSISRISFESGTLETNTKFGVSFKELQTKLKCTQHESELIFASLYNSNEIEYTNVDFQGLISTQKGLTAFSDKKYLIRNNKILLNWAKNFVQIFIPILSLLIAFLALTIKIDNLDLETTNELKYLKQEIELLRNHINNPNLENQKNN